MLHNALAAVTAVTASLPFLSFGQNRPIRTEERPASAALFNLPSIQMRPLPPLPPPPWPRRVPLKCCRPSPTISRPRARPRRSLARPPLLPLASSSPPTLCPFNDVATSAAKLPTFPLGCLHCDYLRPPQLCSGGGSSSSFKGCGGVRVPPLSQRQQEAGSSQLSVCSSCAEVVILDRGQKGQLFADTKRPVDETTEGADCR